MLAYDYPLLGVFWTILWIYVVVSLIMILFTVIVDVFRNHDIGGFAKAIWLIFILFLPFLGVLAYVLSQGDGMARRRRGDVQAEDEAARAYIRDAAGAASPADQVAQLASLRDQGAITEAEFAAGKAKILG